MLSFISTSTIINKEKPKSIYDIKLNDIDGKKIDLRSYKGKFILFVNVASKCGFTRQYEELQSLYENYSEKLMIIALPEVQKEACVLPHLQASVPSQQQASVHAQQQRSVPWSNVKHACHPHGTLASNGAQA